jgi:hypothetical protein
MITTLAFRHLLVRKFRSLFLLLGFSLGVSVMIVLLSVGEAMLEQSRDASLVGGGELTVLPQGIDVEAMRTGGLGSMFFGIDRARFLVRQVLGGSRHRDIVRTVSPGIEDKLLYLRRGDRVVPVRAGGEIPSRAGSLNAGLQLRSGSWDDSPSDSLYIAPNAQQLYDELDRFHLPSRPDSTWAEWHYFNVVVSPEEWWYITYLVGGEIPTGRWGGELLLTHRNPDGRYSRFVTRIPAAQVRFDTARADLTMGRSFVRQRNGVYHLNALSLGAEGRVTIDLAITPAAERYFPPVELRDDEIVSGYVVPGLVANGSGRICVRAHCTPLNGVPAYHDHNWGVWRDVTWEWGNARGQRLSFLYGGIYGPTSTSGADPGVRSPFFLSVLDSLGVKQVLRFDAIQYAGVRSAAGAPGATSPRQFSLVGVRDADTVKIRVQVLDALATPRNQTRSERTFLQMRGHFAASGRLLGETVSDTGSGFFETYVEPHRQ